MKPRIPTSYRHIRKVGPGTRDVHRWDPGTQDPRPQNAYVRPGTRDPQCGTRDPGPQNIQVRPG